MRNKALLPLLVIVLVGVVLSHLDLKEDENGTLLLIDNRAVDIKGEVNDIWTGLRRDCKKIRSLTPNEEDYRQIKRLIQIYSPPSSDSVKLFTVISQQDWILAEAEFAELLPAVVLIKSDASAPNPNLTIIPTAIWSGYTKPWKAAPYIRQYISHQAPQAPNNLIDCFEPKSLSFK